jgi:hypothetical protein
MLNDQFEKIKRETQIYDMYSEGVIQFAPTYKFVPQTDTYDYKKKRIPSFTDRIL